MAPKRSIRSLPIWAVSLIECSRQQYRLSPDVVEEEVADEYFERYRVKIPQDRMSRELHDSEILFTDSDATSFRYSIWLLFHFVAKYFQENVMRCGRTGGNSSTIRVDSELTRSLFNDDAANILMFYVYLTKDPALIREVVEQAKRNLFYRASM